MYFHIFKTLSIKTLKMLLYSKSKCNFKTHSKEKKSRFIFGKQCWKSFVFIFQQIQHFIHFYDIEYRKIYEKNMHIYIFIHNFKYMTDFCYVKTLYWPRRRRSFLDQKIGGSSGPESRNMLITAGACQWDSVL